MRTVRQPKWSLEWLREEYENKKKSMKEISDEQNTYVNKVRRALKYYGLHIRSHDEAQTNALKNGRAAHPTAGKPRGDKVKEQISQKMAKVWAGKSDKEKDKISRKNKKHWDKMSRDKKRQLFKLAARGNRRATEKGSKLERFLVFELQKLGYDVSFHALAVPNNKNMEVDILLAKDKIALEIDGPSHHLPIYGEERLEKRKNADHLKNGLLLSHGYAIIRIKNLIKTLSESYKRSVLGKLIGVLDKIKIGEFKNCVIQIEGEFNGKKTENT